MIPRIGNRRRSAEPTTAITSTKKRSNPQTTFQIGGSGLRLGQKRDPESDADQLCRQLQFRQRRFLHTEIMMGQAMKKSSESKMT